LPDASKESLIAILKAGNFYASSGARFTAISYNPSQKRITVKANRVSLIRYIGKSGHVYRFCRGKRGSYHIKGREKYIRVEITNASGCT